MAVATFRRVQLKNGKPSNKPSMKRRGQTIKDQIQAMPNKSQDAIYQHLAGEAGLFGQAFFGHKATKKEKNQLQNIWKQIQKHTTP